MIYTVHCTDSLQIIILGVSNWFVTQYGAYINMIQIIILELLNWCTHETVGYMLA